MFATRYFAPRYFAPRYWPKVGAVAVAATGGVVWVMVDGASTPPGTTVQGSQPLWLCLNGVWHIPEKRTAPWPRRARPD